MKGDARRKCETCRALVRPNFWRKYWCRNECWATRPTVESVALAGDIGYARGIEDAAKEAERPWYADGKPVVDRIRALSPVTP